ncbi:MAG: hypothetical protein ACOY4R_27410 [Pseudomonadota bacterium]
MTTFPDVVRDLGAIETMPMGAYTYDEVIRIKWAAERVARAMRGELDRRNARTVDEACALTIGEPA